MINGVCFITDFYPPHIGGQEILFQNLTEGISSLGYPCIVVTAKSDKEEAGIEKKDNLIIYRISVPKFIRRFWFAPFALPKIISLRDQFDIMHGTSYGGVLPLFLAGLFLRNKKSVITVHEFMGDKWYDYERNKLSVFFYKTAERIIVRMPFDRFIAVSNYTGNQLKNFGVKENKLEIIYNGSNDDVLSFSQEPGIVRKKLGFDDGDFIFLCYGRTGLTKGIEYFADAIPVLIKEIKNAKVILVISKADKRIWEKIKQSLEGLDNSRVKIFMQLDRSELINYLNCADCIVIPSLSEGFGFNVTEAVLLRKKIVATSVGAIPEVISGEYLLVKAASSNELIKGCLKAYNNELTKTVPKIFLWEDSINKYLDVYNRLCPFD